MIAWRNVDVDVAAEDHLRVQAMQDPLTQLPNRRHLMEMLAAACAADEPFGVLFVDIDRFKAVNDEHGHAVGDAVLHRTGRRLTEALRGTAVVGRLAGDEFVVLARSVPDLEALRSLAQRVLAAREGRHRDDRSAVEVTVSVGGLWVSGGPHDVTAILQAADALMYDAKRRGGGLLQLGALT